MDAQETSTSDTSTSEGEYVVMQERISSTTEKSASWPKFDCSMWNAERSTGLSFISLMPMGGEYKLPNQTEQSDAPGKTKVSSCHRKTRLRGFSSGQTTGRDIADAKRLRHAINANNYPLAEELLDSGVDPCTADEKKRTALHIAATRGDEKMVRLLLDQGAEPNQKDVIGNTPLHLAACTNHVTVVTMLLKAGTDVNALDQSGSTPLHLAKSRLNILQQSRHSSEHLRTEAMHIVDMMKE